METDPFAGIAPALRARAARCFAPQPFRPLRDAPCFQTFDAARLGVAARLRPVTPPSVPRAGIARRFRARRFVRAPSSAPPGAARRHSPPSACFAPFRAGLVGRLRPFRPTAVNTSASVARADARAALRLAHRTAWVSALTRRAPSVWSVSSAPASPSPGPVSGEFVAFHGNYLRAQRLGGEQVPSSVAWGARQAARFSLAAAYRRGRALGRDSLGFVDRKWPEPDPEPPLLTREGEVVLAKRLESGRLFMHRGVYGSSAALTLLLQLGRHALAPDGVIGDVVDLQKYQQVQKALGLNGTADVATAMLRALLDAIAALLRARARLHRFDPAGDPDRVLAPPALHAELDRAQLRVLDRAGFVWWLPDVFFSAASLADASYCYLRGLELTLAFRARLAGCAEADFWALWRGAEARSGWAESARDSGRPGFAAWLTPEVVDEVERELRRARTYCAAVRGDFHEGLVAGAGVRLGLRESGRAQHEFVLANRLLALRTAGDFVCKGKRVNMEDALSAAQDGLIRAVLKYDWRSGWKFSTYSVNWMRQRLQDVLFESHTIRLSPTVRRCQGRVLRATKDLAARTGCEPTAEEVVAYLRRLAIRDGLRSQWPALTERMARRDGHRPTYSEVAREFDALVEAEYADYERRGWATEPNAGKAILVEHVEEVWATPGDPMSLDQPVTGPDGDEGATLAELAADPEAEDAGAAVVLSDRRRNIDRILLGLGGLPQRLLRMHFGLDASVGPGEVDDEGLNEREIAVALGKTVGWVREHLADALLAFRRAGESLFGDQLGAVLSAE